jgi:2-dehydropantoate 2-reductase
MTQPVAWPKIAVVGAGAVGGYFGGMVARAGAPVVMIGRAPFVEAVNQNGLLLDTLHFKESVRVEASTELDAVRGAEVVLFCVKTTDTAETARALAPLLSPNAIVISMQNGVDNAEQIHAASGIDALGAVVYVAASVPQPGTIKHVGRGDLVVGPRNARTEHIVALFEHAGVPCRISDNIEGELWTKLTWNCALNAISALGHARYGEIAASSDAKKIVANLVTEFLAVARAAKVNLPAFEDPQNAINGAYKVAETLSTVYSSTAQDLQRGKRTEIDSLNGYIARRGAELNVPTPVNQALATLVKLAESHS